MNNKKRPEFIYGTAWKKEATGALVAKALASGFRAFDTANQPKHYSEDLVGEALGRHFKGGAPRDSLFIQTKFTPLDGHDSRIPYDGRAHLAAQVEQSFAVSLKNLGVDYVDSYLLHSPYGDPDIGEEDREVWDVFSALWESKKTREIGVSNISAEQLDQFCRRFRIAPMVVQNRCYAARGWDKDVREACRERGIVYQGFSLLTANTYVLASARTAALSSKYGKSATQIVFKFSRQIGMVPMTGTSDAGHMKEDLDIDDFSLEDSELRMLESEWRRV